MSPRVIVTRAHSDAQVWTSALCEAGFDAVALPLVEISSTTHPQSVQAVWQRVHTFDALMFVSSNAVEHFFALKPPQSRIFTEDCALKIRAFVTGPGSFAALRRAQVDARCIDMPDLQADVFDSEALWAVVRQRVRPAYRLLIVRGAEAGGATQDEGQGRDWFARQAVAVGAQVEFLAVYQRACPVFLERDYALAREAAADGSVWVFSSSQAISNLQACCAGQSWQQAKAVATHARIALAARKAGFAVVCESSPTFSSLLASIKSVS